MISLLLAPIFGLMTWGLSGIMNPQDNAFLDSEIGKMRRGLEKEIIATTTIPPISYSTKLYQTPSEPADI